MEIQKNKLPEGWSLKNLGELVKKEKFSLVDGPFGTQLHKNEYTEKGIVLVRIKNITNYGFKEEDLKYISEKKFLELARSAVYPGDILLAKTGATIGKACLFPSKFQKGLLASSCAKISVDKTKVLEKYTLYFIISDLGYNQVMYFSRGSTRTTINLNEIKTIKVPIPFPNDTKKSLEIQRKIVSKLDAFFDSYNKLKEEKQLAKEKYEKILQSAIESLISTKKLPRGWKIRKLSELIVNITSGSRNWKKYYDEEGKSLFIRTQDVAKGMLDLNSIKRINPANDRERKRTKVNEEDVLMTITGWIGKTVVIPKGFPEAYVNQSTALIRVNKKIISPKYLNYFLMSYNAQEQLSKATVGIGRDSLSLISIKKLDVLLPSLETQQKIISKLDTFSKIYKEKIKMERKNIDFQLQQLPKSILSKAFRGELVN